MANFQKFFLRIFLISLTLSPIAQAEIWLPSIERYKTQEKQDTCRDIQSAKAKIEASLSGKDEEIENLTQFVKEAWGKFAACAEENGIPSIRNENDELRAQQACELLHRKWQGPGFNLVIQMKEKKETEKVLKDMDDQAKLYCQNP